MFERFTERARQVVVLAQDEARALKHNYIGTEHILLGLLREEEGLAARVLESLDITVEEVRKGIEAVRRYASDFGRSVPEDHYGVYLSYLITDDLEGGLRASRPYLHPRPDVPDAEISAIGTAEMVRARVREYMEVGVTKFVMRPACSGDDWYRQLELLARDVIAPLQTPFSPEERLKRAAIPG